MHPLSNVWIRAAVPLQYYRQPNRAGFDLASVGKVPRNSFWISTGGVYGPLNAVQAIGVTMQTPLGKPTLEIRSVRLAKEVTYVELTNEPAFSSLFASSLMLE